MASLRARLTALERTTQSDLPPVFRIVFSSDAEREAALAALQPLPAGAWLIERKLVSPQRDGGAQ